MVVLRERWYDRLGTNPRVSEEQKDILREKPRRVDADHLHGPYVCSFCNNHKGTNLSGVDPKTKRIVRLFNPRRHSWHRHFHWDGPLLVGRTAIGRATILVLEINLDYRVDLRQELIDEGVFPPN